MSLSRSGGPLLASAAANALASAAASVALLGRLGPSRWAIFGTALVALRVVQSLLTRFAAPSAIIDRQVVEGTRRRQRRLGVVCSCGLFAYCTACAALLRSWDLVAFGGAAAFVALAVSARVLQVSELEIQFRYRAVAVVELTDALSVPLIALTLVLLAAPFWSLTLAFLVRAALPTLILRLLSPRESAELSEGTISSRSDRALASQAVLFACATLVLPIALAWRRDRFLLGCVDASVLVMTYALLHVQITNRLVLNMVAANRAEAAVAVVRANVAVSLIALCTVAAVAGAGAPSVLGSNWGYTGRVLLLLLPAYALASFEVPAYQAVLNVQGAATAVAFAQAAGLAVAVAVMCLPRNPLHLVAAAMGLQFLAQRFVLRARLRKSIYALPTFPLLCLYAASVAGAAWPLVRQSLHRELAAAAVVGIATGMVGLAANFRRASAAARAGLLAES